MEKVIKSFWRIQTEIMVGPGLIKFFSALWDSVWSKNRVGGGWPPGPSPGSATESISSASVNSFPSNMFSAYYLFNQESRREEELTEMKRYIGG